MFHFKNKTSLSQEACTDLSDSSVILWCIFPSHHSSCFPLWEQLLISAVSLEEACSSLPFRLYSPILLPATDPQLLGLNTLAQLPSSLPFYPMTGPLCYTLTLGRVLLQVTKLTVLRWGNLKGFPPCNSTPLQQRPPSYPQFCCRRIIDLHTLSEVPFFTLGLI